MNRRTILLPVVTGAVLALAPAAKAQSASGAVDIRGDINDRIHELEGMIGETPIEMQIVALRWLADLYVQADRLEEAEQAYEQILVFYPRDLGTSNAYAEFLMDRRHNPAYADTVLFNAIEFTHNAGIVSSYMGRAHALRACALRELKRCDEAMKEADLALTIGDDEDAEDALRVKAGCFADQGRTDAAAETWLFLIGATGGSRPDDVSAYIATLAGGRKPVAVDQVERRVAEAIEQARDARRKATEFEGAALVVLETGDHVRLEGTLRTGDGNAAVLFVPDIHDRRSQLKPYAQMLSLDGITTLAVDLRGQGDSRCDSLPGYDELPEDHRDRLPGDVASAYAYLRDHERIPPQRIAVVSAGNACAVVERAIHEHGLSPVVVYLSPVFDPTDLDLETALRFRPDRPVLVVVSGEDIYAVRSMRGMQAIAGDDAVTAQTYEAAGHGIPLLGDADRFAAMSGWLRSALSPAE